MALPRIELGHSRCKRDGLPLAYRAYELNKLLAFKDY